MHAQFFHDPGPVELNRVLGNPQLVGSFFVHSAGCDIKQHLGFTGR
jgi:hypothetical protein